MERHGIKFLILWLAVCISVGYARAPKKIVSGINAADKEFPYQVSIQKDNKHWCGGSILDATHILTAAHCVISEEQVVERAEDLQVVTGTIWTNELGDGNVFAVSNITAHSYFDYFDIHQIDGPSHYADIAVLKLAQPISFDEFQKPIGLPDSATPSGALVVSTGWGSYDTNGTYYVPWMQKLLMTTLSLVQCQESQVYPVDVGHICATSARGSGICYGDSGGALAYNNTVVGISSWSSACADGLPDIFTDVYHYRHWIKAVMEL